MCYVISVVGQGKHSPVRDATANILVVHLGTGSHDTPHWSMLHDPDRCLQNVQTATIKKSQL